jgi:hypothetical protein
MTPWRPDRAADGERSRSSDDGGVGTLSANSGRCLRDRSSDGGCRVAPVFDAARFGVFEVLGAAARDRAGLRTDFAGADFRRAAFTGAAFLAGAAFLDLTADFRGLAALADRLEAAFRAGFAALRAPRACALGRLFARTLGLRTVFAPARRAAGVFLPACFLAIAD